VEGIPKSGMMWLGRSAQSVRGNDTGLEIAESRVTQMVAAGTEFPVSWISYECRWVLLTLIINMLLTWPEDNWESIQLAPLALEPPVRQFDWLFNLKFSVVS
jgi:hypothetical protein